MDLKNISTEYILFYTVFVLNQLNDISTGTMKSKIFLQKIHINFLNVDQVPTKLFEHILYWEWTHVLRKSK